MSYHPPTNSIVEVQVVGRVFNQRTRNVFHYGLVRVGGGVFESGRVTLGHVGSMFAENVYTAFTPCVSEDWTVEYIQCQFIDPVRYRLRQFTAADLILQETGEVASPSQAPSVTACISLFMDGSGREFQGRRYLPALPSSFNDSGNLSGPGVTAFRALADSCVAPYDWIGDDPFTMYPTLLTGNFVNGEMQYITSKEVSLPLRSQRRREVGRGE